MPKIHLDVPYVSQVDIGGHVPGADARDERKGCWYAAACMLGYYREHGPRLGLPSLYLQSDGSPRLDKAGKLQPSGVNSAGYPQLVANEGWVNVPLPATKAWTCEQLADILQHHGPCYVRTLNASGGGHIVVLVGVDTDTKTVLVHDPARGPNLSLSIGDFNNKFNWGATSTDYGMMYKPA